MYPSPLYKMLKGIYLDQRCCTKTHQQSLNLMHHLLSNYNALNCHRGEQFNIKREIWIRDFWFVFTLLKPWKVTGLTDPDYTSLLKHCNQRTKNRILNVTTPESFLWVREFQDTRPLGFLFLPLLTKYRGRPLEGFPVHRVHLCGSCAVSSCSKIMAVQSLMPPSTAPPSVFSKEKSKYVI